MATAWGSGNWGDGLWGGGTPYSDSVTETVAASDSASASTSYGDSVSESAVFTDALGGGQIFAVSVTEQVSAYVGWGPSTWGNYAWGWHKHHDGYPDCGIHSGYNSIRNGGYF